MAEEIKEEVVAEKVVDGEESQVQEAPQLSAKEASAAELGWKPKEQYDGDPDEWVSANEFLRRGELFGRINDYKHKIGRLEASVDALTRHNAKMFETKYQEQIADIKQARKVALREGDVEVVEELDERLDKTESDFAKKREELKQELKKPMEAGPHPSWEPWVEQNNWYAKDAELRGYADGVAAKIVAEARENSSPVDFNKLLSEVSRKVKSKFAEKFPKSERQRTSERDGGEGKQKASGVSADLRAVENSLSDGEKEIMTTLVRNGAMTKEKYLKQIQEYNKKRGFK